MKLTITVKQDKQKIIKLDEVTSYYFDKAYLVCKVKDQNHWFKTSTVLELEES